MLGYQCKRFYREYLKLLIAVEWKTYKYKHIIGKHDAFMDRHHKVCSKSGAD